MMSTDNPVQLFAKSEPSDVKLVVEGREFHAHKSILSASSEVFAAMFSHDMQENIGNSVRIEHMSHEVFASLLRFVYAKRVDDIGRLAGELLAAADRYAVEELKKICVTYLRNDLTLDNAIEYLHLADLFNAAELSTHASQFVIANAEKFIRRPEFASLISSHEDLITRVVRALPALGEVIRSRRDSLVKRSMSV